jgi:4-oxalocrotonate tautomerase family enzyme
VRVEWLEGRTQEQRQRLVDAITRSVTEIADVAVEQVTVVFEEIPRHLQAKGGVFWSDRDRKVSS